MGLIQDLRGRKLTGCRGCDAVRMGLYKGLDLLGQEASTTHDAPDSSPLGGLIQSAAKARGFANDDPLVGVDPQDNRDLVELIVADNGGTLEGQLRLHGASGAPYAGINAVWLWKPSTVAHASIAASPSPASSFDSALTNTICNGITIPTPLGVTTLTFDLGTTLANIGSVSAITRARVQRATAFGGEHWGGLRSCGTSTTGGVTSTHFRDHVKLVPGKTLLTQWGVTGVTEVITCSGSFWVGGGVNGGHVNDSSGGFTFEVNGTLNAAWMTGAYSAWAFEGSESFDSGDINGFDDQCLPGEKGICGDDNCGSKSMAFYSLGPGGNQNLTIGSEWVGVGSNLPSGWPGMT